MKKQLEKAQTEKPMDEKLLMDLLERLSDVDMTLDILKKTKIGKSVNDLGKATEKGSTVAKVCKSLVAQWRKLLDKDAAGNESDAGSVISKATNKDGASTTPIARTSSNASSSSKRPEEKKELSVSKSPQPAKKPSPGAPQSSSGNKAMPDSPASSQSSQSTAVARRVSVVDVDFPKCGDATRDSCRKILAQALATDADPSGPDPGKVAADCETSIFKLFKGTDSKYKNCVRSRRHNLLQNSKLRRDVLTGAVGPDKLASMTNQEMATSEVLKEIEKAEKEALMDAQTAGPSQARTNMFKCGKCKGNDCFYFQMQTRSADEPMTTFVTCANCQHKWRFC